LAAEAVVVEDLEVYKGNMVVAMEGYNTGPYTVP
jgi:hypothetical protein